MKDKFLFLHNRSFALLIVFFICSLTGLLYAADMRAGVSISASPSRSSAPHSPDYCLPCEKFHELNSQIRDGRIDKKSAAARFRMVMAELAEYTAEINQKMQRPTRCVFPLTGYAPDAIGGKKGSGYVEAGYDYFDGNAHGGHPAHDLFMRDRNQDSLDDGTGNLVAVVAMEGGLIVSVENNWAQNSPLRGGRYLWIYNPWDSSLTYYAHNETILVRIGDWVKPGAPVATVGRTGHNALQKRSPTHLHLMHLKVEGGRPRPVNRFGELSACTLQ